MEREKELMKKKTPIILIKKLLQPLPSKD